MQLLCHMIIAYWVFKETAKLFSRAALQSHQECVSEWSTFSTSLPAFGDVACFYFSHSVRCVVIPYYGFNLHFPHEYFLLLNIFHVLIWLYMLFQEVFDDVFCQFSKWIVTLLNFEVLKYILHSSPLLDTWFFNFSWYIASFHPLNRIVCRTKYCSSDAVQFIDVFAFGVKSKNSLL